MHPLKPQTIPLGRVLRGFLAFRILLVVLAVAFSAVYTYTRLDTPTPVHAATSSNLNFQARLLTASGNTVPDGYYNISFNLYNVSTGGASLWSEQYYDSNGVTAGNDNRVRVVNGYLSVNLASQTAFPNLNWDQDMWLTMNVGGSAQTATPTYDGEMTPRIKLTAVPYAFQAKQAEALNKTTAAGGVGTVDFSSLTADRKFLFPDTSLATTASPGTICVYNGAASNCPAASGSAYYIQNDTVLQLQSNFHIQARDSTTTGTVGGIIRGAAAGQTVDLFQLQGSNGVVLTHFDASGNLAIGAAAAPVSRLNIGVNTDTTAAGGITFGTDTNLYRSASDTLKTDDALVISGGLQPVVNAGNGSAAANSLTVSGAKGGNTSGATGQIAGTGGAISLTGGIGGDAPGGSTNGNGGNITIQGGSPGAGLGAAGSYGNLLLQSSGGKVGIGTAALSGSLLTVGGDTGTAAGGMSFGTGTSNLYRKGAGYLYTDGEFGAASYVCANATTACLGATAAATPGAGIAFGSSFDTNLYRGAANLLQTDDSFAAAGNVSVGTTAYANTTLTVYNPNESILQTDLTQALNKSGINIVTNNTNNSYTPGLFWSTDDDNATKPKAGIYLHNDTALGTSLLFGTSNSYLTGITNTALTIGPSGDSIFSNDLAINGGDLTTTATTFNLLNTSVTTLNIGAAVGAGGINLAGGSGSTGCTIDGSTGNLTCSGNITGNATGTVGYFSRSGTIIQPATAGDSIQTSGNLATTGTGTVTSAGILNANATGKTAITIADSGTQSSGLTIGGDTNLYRSAADTLKTDDNFIVGGNFTGNGAALFKNSTNSTTAFQVQNAAGANLLAVDTSTASNLIANGDIEGAATTGWTAKGSSTLTQSSVQQWQGNSSLSIAATAAANDGAQYGYTFTASTQYTLSFYAKVASGTITDVNIGRQDVSGTDIDCLAGQTLTTSWTRFTCTFTTGLTITSSNLYIKKTGIAAETFYTDGVQLQTGAATSAFDPGGRLQFNGIVNSPVTLQNKANSTTAFQIQNAAGTSNLFVADTANTRIGIGTAAPNATLHVVGSTTLEGGIINFNVSSNFATNINTGTSTGAIAIGNSASSGFILESGTGAINLFNGATAHTINFATGAAAQSVTIGSTNTTSALRLQAGTGGFNLNPSGVSNTGVTVQPGVNSTNAFVVTDLNGLSQLKVDNINGVGISLGNATPQATLDINGFLRIGGGAYADFLTPVGSTVRTKINIPIDDPGNFGQLLAFGLPSTASTSSRAISVFDARTVAHQPSLGVFDPSESDIIGLSWDGSSTTAYLKTLGANVAIRSNITDIATFLSNGNTSLAGDLAVLGGDITTTATTASIFNTNAQTINFGGGATSVINIGPGGATAGTVSFLGGTGNTGCSMDGVTGNLTCSGNITGGATGTQGYFARSGTTLQPATAGDSIQTSGNLATTGTGTITSAGLLIGQAGIAVTGAAINLNVSSNFATNINTGTSTGAITIGNNNGNTAINIDSGTSAINIGTGAQARSTNIATGAAAQSVVIGSTSTTSTLALQGGNTASAISIQSASGGTISLASSGVANSVQIGNTAGAVTQAINIGNNATLGSVTNLVLGSNTTGSTTILQGGSTSGVLSRADGTNAFRIQSSTGATTIFNADVTNTRITIGASAGTLASRNLEVGIAEFTSKVRIGSATNGVAFDDTSSGAGAAGAGKLRRYGTALESKSAMLSPEFAGAVLTGDGATNTGAMTSDFCSGTSRLNINVSGSSCAATDEHNYYSWTAQATNDYDIWTRWQAPSDFAGWDTTPLQFNAWRTGTTESVTVTVYKAGVACGTAALNGVEATTTWTVETIASMGGCTVNANDNLTIRIQLSVGTNNNFARIGEITLNYKSSF